MRNKASAIIVLTALFSFASGCSGTVDGAPTDVEDPLRSWSPIANLPKEHSFYAPSSWTSHFTFNDGYETADTPVLFGRVNADAKDDFIGFGSAGVWVGLSTGTQLASVQYVLGQFGTSQGWNAARHVRLVGDINHDGRDDIVGFGDAGVYTALSDGTGFSNFRFVLQDLGYNQGWRTDKHVRMLADVNGDHNKDIVAFGDAGVYVSFADGAGGFGPAQFVVANFGTQQAWTSATTVRTTVDLNHDGRDDLVGFGTDGVWTALSTGAGFAAPRFVLASYGYNQAWRVDTHPRFFADLDGDGRKDIVAFGQTATYSSRSLGDGTFGPMTLVSSDCGAQSHKQCAVADLNGDSYGDLIAFQSAEWNQALGQSDRLLAEQAVLHTIAAPRSWTTADLDGNGMADLVSFENDKVTVALSKDASPAPPPAMPSDLHFTAVGSYSVMLSWTDNSTDEIGFPQQYRINGGVVTDGALLRANSTLEGMSGFYPGSNVCFRIRSLNIFTYSDWTAWTCATLAPDGMPSTGTGTLWMNEDPAPSGAVTYTVNWVPGGRTLTRFRSSYTNGDQILFVKANNDPSQCYANPSSVISLASNGSLTQSQIAQISWKQPDGSIDFHGCLGEVQPSQTVAPYLVFNADWNN